MQTLANHIRSHLGLAADAQSLQPRLADRVALLGWLAACVGLPMWLALRY
jgi:hypothetical protein